MIYEFDAKKFMQVKPMNLKAFFVGVLGKDLPSIQERGQMFEDYGLGEAEEYIGLAGQNQAILDMLELLAEKSTLA